MPRRRPSPECVSCHRLLELCECAIGGEPEPEADEGPSTVDLERKDEPMKSRESIRLLRDASITRMMNGEWVSSSEVASMFAMTWVLGDVDSIPLSDNLAHLAKLAIGQLDGALACIESGMAQNQ